MKRAPAFALACLILIAFLASPTYSEESESTPSERLLSLGVREIVFAERTLPADGHWYANFGYFYNGPRNTCYGNRGRLCKLDVATGQVTALLEDLEGTVRDPQVHYDAEKILFSYRQGGAEQFHLYEINIDGTGLTQLTDGIFDDMEPCYLPDGGIAFISSRSKRWVQCWLVNAATLHRCDADGSNIRRISANVEMDNTPWVLPDGRLIYMRWEYVDRSQVKFHHLWTSNPDGTNQTIYFGNMHPTGVFLDPKPIPGTNDILFIDSPGHGRKEHAGFVSIVNDRQGPDALSAKRHVSETEYRDPYPISEDCFLAATNNGIDVLDASGNASRLLTIEGTMHEPRPLIRRPRERVIPSRVDYSNPTGTLFLDNVYVGRNMEGIEQGEIKKLLVLETLPKPLNYGSGMHDFIPISHGGTFTLERILGTVPVEADGSAHFELPANRPLFFIALDENNSSVKRMHSFLSVMPGETLACIGCHEERTNTPQPMSVGVRRIAMQRGPSQLTPVPNVPFMIDFPSHVQPILDCHCVECHNPDKPEGKVLLNGDHGCVYSISYFTLSSLGLFSDGRNYHGNTAPHSVGDSASPLMTMLDGTHHDVQLSSDEIEVIRNWIHIGAPYPGTAAALGTGMVRHDNLPQGYGAAYQQAQAAHERRCKECHNGELPTLHGYSIQGGNNGLRDTHLTYNLTRPEKSPMLMAPLAQDADGWGMHRRDAEGNPVGEMIEVFENTDDPDYLAILNFIEMGRLCLDQNKRWDMPGFKPHPFYVREMKRYGVLSETFDLERDEIDVFEVDRRYWESGWYEFMDEKPPLYPNENFQQTMLTPHVAVRVAPAGAMEGESLTVVRCDGGRYHVQDMKPYAYQWSEDKHLLWINGQPDDSIAIEFDVQELGRYSVTLRMTKARDYGVFQLYLDEEKMGGAVDLYSTVVEPTAPITFSDQSLSAGKHVLRAEVIGSSSELPDTHRVGKYLFGLDYLSLEKD
jgi:hypothetical protein